MDNATLKALIDEYGDRICAFFIDNEHKILFNYPNSPKISEVELLTIGGLDFYKIPYVGSSQRPVVKFAGLYRTDCIQHLIFMEPEYADYRVDPMIFR